MVHHTHTITSRSSTISRLLGNPYIFSFFLFCITYIGHTNTHMQSYAHNHLPLTAFPPAPPPICIQVTSHAVYIYDRKACERSTGVVQVWV